MLEDIFLLSQNFIRLNNRAYKRYILHKEIFKNRFSILVGQRGVGKTTSIIQYLVSKYKDFFSKKILYVPSDHFKIGTTALYEIAENFFNLGGEIICFDEIHKYKDWSRELKSIYDTFPKLKMIASGSSVLEIAKGTHDLARRAIIYNLEGLSFREFIELRYKQSLDVLSMQQIISDHEATSEKIVILLEKEIQNKVLVLFKEYLQIGYYPYFLEYDDPKLYYLTLEQNIHTTLESDLPAIYPAITGASINKIKRLLSIIASSVPFTPDLKTLKELLDIGDERTLKIYLKYLEDAGLIRTLLSSRKGLRKLEKPEKIYLNNTNQIYALENNDIQNVGNIRETFFLNSVSAKYPVSYTSTSDFLVDASLTFEIGGKNKDFSQIKNIKHSFIAVDDIERGSGRKIPLWLFGFLY